MLGPRLRYYGSAQALHGVTRSRWTGNPSPSSDGTGWGRRHFAPRSWAIAPAPHVRFRSCSTACQLTGQAGAQDRTRRDRLRAPEGVALFPSLTVNEHLRIATRGGPRTAGGPSTGSMTSSRGWPSGEGNGGAPAVGRGAADAGDRAGAPRQPEAPDHGRAIRRARPGDRRDCSSRRSRRSRSRGLRFSSSSRSSTSRPRSRSASSSWSEARSRSRRLRPSWQSDPEMQRRFLGVEPRRAASSASSPDDDPALRWRARRARHWRSSARAAADPTRHGRISRSSARVTATTRSSR